MDIIEQTKLAMIEYDKGDPKRIQHFLKVHSFARLIGTSEGMNERELTVLEIAALMHDIGIHPALEKYGRCDGKLQEKEGIFPARQMLMKLRMMNEKEDNSTLSSPASDEKSIRLTKEEEDRVVFLISHHHTITDVQGIDWQVLLEADFLVNSFEENMKEAARTSALSHVFCTKTGRELMALEFCDCV